MLVYASVLMAALMSFAVLAIDWGHVQAAKTEIMNAATAAARAGVDDLASGGTVATTSAITQAKYNTVDGSAMVLTSPDVAVGTWNPATATFTAGTASPNAVKVIARRCKARSTAIPMLFGNIVGVPTCDISCTAIASNHVDTQVNLSSYYDHKAFVADGTTFNGSDGVHGGYALSATLLGGTVTRGVTTYALGPANSNNALRCSGQTVTLPSGDYKSVVLLVAQAYGPVTNAFTLNNTDGTTTVYNQSVSDWCAPRSTITNENVCSTMAYRDLGSGGTAGPTTYVLSYELPITSASGVASIRMPVSSNLNVLAIGLTPAAAMTVR